MPDYRLVKKCYTMLKLFDSNGQINWLSHIRSLLRSNGYGYIWNNQCVHNKNLFILSFTQRLKDHYLQEWNNSLHEIYRLNYYTLIKRSYYLNKCAEVLNIRKFRHFYFSLKIGSLDLEVNRGRYYNIPRDERVCKLCKSNIEDEYHFMMKCPFYQDLRQKHLSNKFIENPNVHKYVMLLSSNNDTIIYSVATFIHAAWQKRKMLLTELSV